MSQYLLSLHIVDGERRGPKTPEARPSSANISPTSPLGTMEIPTAVLKTMWRLNSTWPPASLPNMAIVTVARENSQINPELQSTWFRSSDSPTTTKKIGVKSWMMGVVWTSMRWANAW